MSTKKVRKKESDGGKLAKKDVHGVSLHDPRRLIENLRNHLAAHDKPLAFLFGAGTSAAVNEKAADPPPGERPMPKPLVPAIGPMTNQCKAAVGNMGEPFSNAWQLLESECRTVNVETILSRLHSKIDAIGTEKLLGLSKSELERMESIIRKTIAGAVMLKEEKIPDRLPHDDFAGWVKRADRVPSLEIFTTNYDVLFERALERVHAPFFDGFVGGYEPFFYEESLEREELLPADRWVRLWKIHGSVNWKLVTRCAKKRIIRGEQSTTGEMIFPSHRKYDQSRKQPYTALMDRLGKVLSRKHALLISCGYGFGDEHINALIFTVLENRQTSNMVALHFGELAHDSPLVKWSKEKKNLMVIGANGGVIGGRWGTWRLLNPVDDQTHSFMDTAFDSDATEPESANASLEEDRAGRMRLGDFNWFCKFLNTMGRKAEGKR